MGREIGWVIKESLKGLSAVEKHDKIVGLYHLAKRLATEADAEVFEYFEIGLGVSLKANFSAPDNFDYNPNNYYLYFSKLTDYQVSILDNLGYTLLKPLGFEKSQWSKKLNLK